MVLKYNIGVVYTYNNVNRIKYLFLQNYNNHIWYNIHLTNYYKVHYIFA
jgi:hypothetical protein